MLGLLIKWCASMSEQDFQAQINTLSRLLIEHEQSNQRTFQAILEVQQENQRTFTRLAQMIESNAKAIQALSDNRG